MNPLLIAKAVDRVHKLRRKHGAQRLADRFSAAQRIHSFHLRVPALDPIVQVDGKDSHVDRLDDVLVELLQPLELADLLLQPRIETRVLQSDADVAGQRFQQFHVFARKKVSADRSSQPDYGDRSRR